MKGADNTVLGALAPMRAGSAEAAAYERTRSLLSEYSRAGLRTLVMAKRTMQPALWEEWLAGHARACEIGEGIVLILETTITIALTIKIKLSNSCSQSTHITISLYFFISL